ncbi:hypothetical protein LOTGIDRAFT_203908 [Lottia gigantea]|uniref:Tetraspanin n=1 Tax=Lottia gigantea TaxID=225164 RepID=V4BZA3_LOTGI|nr:hypothetical protein LOTGIDRAFT_203908 [Lottia gigantea]ESO94469.1 hypothetical protein LOTGIDRAFT_203908 [Lottia gigantea]
MAFIFINFLFWAIGLSVVGFVSWLLATNPSVTNFLSGTFIFTYTLITLGIIIFFIGLFGCIGGCLENPCTLKTYIGFITTLFFLEICAILAAYVQKDQIPKYTASGWKEFNPVTRALVQSELRCCGYNHSSEYSVTLEQLPDSCFDNAKFGPGTITTKTEQTLFQDGCWEKIELWINSNTPIWASTLAVVALIQIASMVTSCLVLEKVQRANPTVSPHGLTNGASGLPPMAMKGRPQGRSSISQSERV